MRLLPIAIVFAVASCAPPHNGLSPVAAGPAARACSVVVDDPVTYRDSFQDTRAASLTMTPGGWCGYTMTLLRTRVPVAWEGARFEEPPAHGMARARPEGDHLVLEYSPAPGYVGTDAFAVRMLPGNRLRRVRVTVAETAQPGPPVNIFTLSHFGGWLYPDN